MAKCKLTQNITKETCSYGMGGVKSIYLINYDMANEYEISVDGKIESIKLPTEEKAFHIEFLPNTASYTDDLAENGNGGKYRTHTVNFTLSNDDYAVLNQDKALSLGRFVAVLVDKAGDTDAPGRAIMLGRNNGLTATAFNYASGAAEADAYGWTVTMAGSELEMARMLKDEAVITSISSKVVVTP